MRYTRLLLVLSLALLGCGPGDDVTLSVWERLERTLPIAVEAANPFDPNEVAVDVELIGPGGRRKTVPAFLYEGFTRSQSSSGSEVLAADGSREWRFRFTPTRPGVWRWRWLRVTAGGEEAGEWECFRVLPNLDPERHGFLRIPDGAKHLEFEDGTPFFAVGENLSWADRRGTGAYEDWIAKLVVQPEVFGTVTHAFSNGEFQKAADTVQIRVNPRHLVKRLCVDGAFQASAPEAPSEYLCS